VNSFTFDGILTIIMKTFFSCLITWCLFFSFNCVSQNLVPNPSFEDTLGCPHITGQLYLANGWKNCGGTPDYFNACYTTSVSGMGVPANVFGNQTPKDGNGYSGFALYVRVVAGVREFVGIPLSQPLIIGQDYFVSFYVSLADTLSLDCAINNIGLKFFTSPLDSTSPPAITNSADIFTSTIISDKSNWTEISGWFTADSSYNFIAIGNFFDDASTDTLNCLSTAYYYLDRVCVTLNSEQCMFDVSSHENNLLNDIGVYPNPADKNLNINVTRAIDRLRIITAEGKQIYNQQDIGYGLITIPLDEFPNGIYFAIIYSNDKIRNFSFQIIHN
jgi:hypothetical protein